MDRDALCYIAGRICLQFLKEQLDLDSVTFAVIVPATATLLCEASGLHITHALVSHSRGSWGPCFFVVRHRTDAGQLDKSL